MDDLNNLWPVTIVRDRYMGTYSGGDWVAWHADVDEVAHYCADADGGDNCAIEFWERVKSSRNRDVPSYGLGATPEQALRNLTQQKSPDTK